MSLCDEDEVQPVPLGHQTDAFLRRSCADIVYWPHRLPLPVGAIHFLVSSLAFTAGRTAPSLLSDSDVGDNEVQFSLHEASMRPIGNYPEAEKLNQRVYVEKKRLLSQEHPYTLSSMANLASTYWNQGGG